MSERLEKSSAAKSEMQSKLDDLIGQEASLKLREQLLNQETVLVRQQNEMLSREVESKSAELLSVRKEKVTMVAELEGKLAMKELEVCLCVCVCVCARMCACVCVCTRACVCVVSVFVYLVSWLSSR